MSKTKLKKPKRANYLQILARKATDKAKSHKREQEKAAKNNRNNGLSM